ncbi:MAG: hypothetical protein R3B09_18775 [Nannocystaceae bacterium]
MRRSARIFAVGLALAGGCGDDRDTFTIAVEDAPERVIAGEAAPVTLRVDELRVQHLPIVDIFPRYPVDVELRADPGCAEDPAFTCGAGSADAVIESVAVAEEEVVDHRITVDLLQCDPGAAPSGATSRIDARIVVVDAGGTASPPVDLTFTCVAP